MLNLSQEGELLRICARARIQAETGQRIGALVREKLDWELVLELAGRNGLASLLQAHLKSWGGDAVPTYVTESLRHQTMARARRNLHMTAELLRLVRLMHAAGIAVVVYKGPVLAANVYGNLAWRSFCDLDLLIHGDDIARVTRLLTAEGYLPNCHLTGTQQAALQVFENELGFYDAARDVLVEVHWNFRGRHYYFGLEPERLWKRLQPTTLMGVAVQTLCTRDMLLLLCVGGAGHGYASLGAVVDIAELLRTTPDLDWPAVVEEAGRLRCRRMLALGATLAGDLLDAPVPGSLRAEFLADPIVDALAQEIRARIFASTRRPFEWFTQMRFYLLACESPMQRISFGLRTLLAPTSRDLGAFAFSRPLFLLYYLARPLRLVTARLRRGARG